MFRLLLLPGPTCGHLCPTDCAPHPWPCAHSSVAICGNQLLKKKKKQKTAALGLGSPRMSSCWRGIHWGSSAPTFIPGLPSGHKAVATISVPPLRRIFINIGPSLSSRTNSESLPPDSRELRQCPPALQPEELSSLLRLSSQNITGWVA